jgi:hypothetical protein
MKKIILTLFVAIIMSTSLVSQASSCKKAEAPNFEQGKNIGGFDKKAAIEKGEKDAENPVAVLSMCAISMVKAGLSPNTIINGSAGCVCKEAVKKLCKINGMGFLKPKDGANLAMCIPLAPLVLGSFKL